MLQRLGRRQPLLLHPPQWLPVPGVLVARAAVGLQHALRRQSLLQAAVLLLAVHPRPVLAVASRPLRPQSRSVAWTASSALLLLHLWLLLLLQPPLIPLR